LKGAARRLWMIALIALVMLLAGCGASDAETGQAVPGTSSVYYVSPQGDDDNDGQTRETAFRAIGQALEAVRPGDTVLVAPGTCSEALTLEGVGDSSALTVIRGEGGVPVLDGQETLTIGLWCEGCTSFVFENLENPQLHRHRDRRSLERRYRHAQPHGSPQWLCRTTGGLGARGAWHQCG